VDTNFDPFLSGLELLEFLIDGGGMRAASDPGCGTAVGCAAFTRIGSEAFLVRSGGPSGATFAGRTGRTSWGNWSGGTVPPPRLEEALGEDLESLPDIFEKKDDFLLPFPSRLFRKASKRLTLSLHCNSIS